MSVIFTAAVAILVLGILVFVHELGHFLFAKWCGVGVVKFAVGFGPAICKFRHKETDYQLGCIPLGGFVRMVGDMPDVITGEQETDAAVREEAVEEAPNELLEEAFRDRNRWFIEKSLWQRAAIVFAGPLFNFIFAAFVISLIDTSATIGKVRPDSPAQQAGLQSNDTVLRIDGTEIDDWGHMAETIYFGSGSSIKLDVRRSGEDLSIDVTPRLAQRTDTQGEVKEFYAIGIEPASLTLPSLSSLYRGGVWTVKTTALTYSGLWSILSGQLSAKEGLAGPVTIYKVAVHHAERGLKDLLFFIAFVSVSLAAINLLPIPILDGGHLLFFLIEGLFGPISIRKKEFAQQVGLLLILLLMVFAIHNDLTRDPLESAPDTKIQWKNDTELNDTEQANTDKPTGD